jgi:hypothetical protein
MSYQIQMHEFWITDHEAREQWEALLGFEIKTPTVRLTHECYEKHAAKISAIQMMAALRLKEGF